LNPLIEDPDTGSTLVRLPLVGAVMEVNLALQFVYPDGFAVDSMHKSSILAATDEDGDEWNLKVQV
jgi:hypothetical protein